MSAGPALATRLFQGQPCVELTLPSGDRARVALFGAQVLSWVTADGTERIRAEDWAERLGTIGYEIVCGLSKRVSRHHRAERRTVS